MRPLFVASVLLMLALCTASATGQPMAGSSKPKPADEKKANPTDAAITAALANDPDVKMARAKMQLAEAELAKARQSVAIKVVILKSKIDQLKNASDTVTAQFNAIKTSFERGSVSQSELLLAREKLEAAKGALASAEAEWKLLVGEAGNINSAPGAVNSFLAAQKHTAAESMYLSMLAAESLKGGQHEAYLHMLGVPSQRAIKGPIPDRIRLALDKPVKLATAGQSVTFQAATDVFKTAGLDVPFRVKIKIEPLASEGEELPIGAWLQLFLDSNPGTMMVVREYGILVVKKGDAPPDAIGIMDFWKQKLPAKEVKEIKPDPMPKK